MHRYMAYIVLMGKSNKAITKECPFCELQVAVACKSCPGCSHSFHNAKRLSLAQSLHYMELNNGNRRRTERIKREKPNYYDSSEFERKNKKKRQREALENGRIPLRPHLQTLKKKNKKKINRNVKEEDDEPPIITSEKAKQCSIILAELNRKMSAATWRK